MILALLVGLSRLLTNAGGESQAYTGVARFMGPATCTAWLLATSNPELPAYLMTNAHCTGSQGQPPNDVMRDRELASGTAVFHYFIDTQERQLRVSARNLVWASMKGTDLAIIELGATLAQLMDAGVTPLAFEPQTPAPGEPVIVVGAPANNVPPDERFLRLEQCTAGAAVELVEFTWHFTALRNGCTDIFGGSSGSPVISARSGRVIAIMNTSTVGSMPEGSDFPCYLNYPCEVSQAGRIYSNDTSYAPALAGLDRCFPGGRFDVAAAGCPLDPGGRLMASTPRRVQQPPASWDVTLSGDVPVYRYKTFVEGRGDCKLEAGYGPPAQSNRIVETLPSAAGGSVLCVWPTASPVHFALEWHSAIDARPPDIPVRYRLDDAGERYVLQPFFAPPALSDYSYKVTSSPEDTCARIGGYLPYRRIPVSIPKRDDPYRACLIARDEAGNAAPPVEILLRGTQVLPGGIRNAASFLPGPLAPGSYVTILGVNLEGAPVEFQGAALTPTYVSSQQLNVRLPENAGRGPATLKVGEVSTTVEIASPAPGLFTAAMNGFGPPIVYADGRAAFSCVAPGLCQAEPIEPGERTLTLFATGTAGSARVLIGGVRLLAESVTDNAGVQTLMVRLPGDFPLRGYLPLAIEAGGRVSNETTIRIRGR
jgi:uncharacterized protein (TIGR03437 family)